MIILLFSLVILVSYSQAQSTCPVIQPPVSGGGVISPIQLQQQRCKCGIKIDGHIYIYCARKQLKQLPKFTRSSILYDELILSGNSMSQIRTNSFTGLKVKRLYLDDNPWRSIEPNSFVELANYLEELYISVSTSTGSQIETIKTSTNGAILIDLSQEKIVSVANPTRTKLPTKLFQNLLNLKIIRLNGLDLSDERSRSFFDQADSWSHEYEPSSSNIGGGLRQYLFNRTRKLESIQLVDCNIRRVESNAFSGVEASLRELNLDNNQLSTTSDIFGEVVRMRRLKVLNLSRNRITQLVRFVGQSAYKNEEDTESNFGNELQLDLSFNSINKIDELAFGVLSKNIVKLNLNNNELTQFQLSFLKSTSFKLDQLRELHLDYNKIEFLPDYMLQTLSKLELLSLKGNLIQHLSNEFTFYGLNLSLRKLNLASNRIRSIHRRVLTHVSKLRELNLERNQLGSSANISFDADQQELKSLNLEANGLGMNQIQQIMQSLSGLESLKLGHNPIKQFDSKLLETTFKHMKNLSHLDMQNCGLTLMPYFVGLNSSLTMFNLAQNGMCNVNGGNLRRMYFKLRSLNLNMNPLRCDCRLVSLKQWLDETIQLNAATVTAQITTSTVNGGPPVNENDLQSAQQQYMPLSVNWKCASPNFNLNKFLNRLQATDMLCFNDDSDDDTGSYDSNGLCEIDEDLNSKKTTTSTRSSSTKPKTSPTTTILVATPTNSTSNNLLNQDIQIIQPHPNLILQSISEQQPATRSSSPQVPIEFSAASPSAAAAATSFFSSNEFKQTLIGSLIGAVSVLTAVFLLVCVVKTTRSKLLLCSQSETASNNETKELNIHSIDNRHRKPKYEMGKLSLQTLCINSSGSSSSSSSSSSSGSANNSNLTGNTNCFCSIIHPSQLDPTLAPLTANPVGLIQSSNSNAKLVDPLRCLTLINAKSMGNNNNNGFTTLYQPNYFQAATSNNGGLISNNLHYLASNLPYSLSSPNETTTGSTMSSSASPIPPPGHPPPLPTADSNSDPTKYCYSAMNASINDATMCTNTYDKLHQQRNITTSTNTLIRVPLAQALNFGTLRSPNTVNSNGNNETTPFLIITDMNRFLLEQNANNEAAAAFLMHQQHQQQQLQHHQMLDSSSQQSHTYHEIGDVLLNFKPNFKSVSSSHESSNGVETTNNKKPSEMYI